MKVLIVEDDFFSRKYLLDLLTFASFNCVAAKNGYEALDIYDEFKPDVVLTDIQMPGMSGLQLLEEIKKRKQNTIIIMTTAYGSEDFAIRALQLGANNYLKKPIQDTDIIPVLRKYESILGQPPNAFEFGKAVKRNLILEFTSGSNVITKVVERLMWELDPVFDENEKINIELGLLELITNALEHGNLAITYEEKVKAMQNLTFDELVNERLANPILANRHIFVEYEFDLNCCQWTISDEGDGFDWTKIPNPTSDSKILELSGRGIFITRFLFDEMEYLGKGNIVRVKKNIGK